ncbi:ABC transporter ATP-binding protein [candidate division KSB1 bacterium]|nr:ABC transporter ATP-binding protein [candidate division KSB1 bacterium]
MFALKALLPFLRPYRRPFLLGSLFALTNNAIGVLVPWLLKLAVDELQSGTTSSELGRYAGLILLVAVASGVLRFFMRYILIGVSRKVELDLRNAIFATLQRLPLSYYNRRRTGDLISRSSSDLDSVRNVLGPGIMYPIDTLTMAAFALVMMVMISGKLTLLTLAAAPVVSLSVFWLGKASYKLQTRIQEQYSALTDCAQENFAGVRVVRAFSQEQRELEKFDGLNREYVRRNLAMTKVQALFMPVMFLLFEIGTALILLIGGRAIIGGEISLGDFVAFVGYLSMLAWPMIAVGWVANLFQRGAASMKRISEILDTRPEIADPPGGRVPDFPRGEIQFDGVNFSYTGERENLGGIDLKIPAGSTVAFVGRTGSGKSTLASLVPRLLDPGTGTVRIDGIPTTEWKLAELRAMVGMVPQDALLFSDTLRNNICFGITDPDPAKFDAVTRTARLAKDVEQFHDGYHTLVGERGLTLSGGQKGRAALARALIRDPRILILDDALAAVDTHTEEEILQGLREFMRGRTSILISHRISTVKDADQIFVLDKGRLIEQGTHAELIARGGYYADLDRMQTLEAELETLESDPVA